MEVPINVFIHTCKLQLTVLHKFRITQLINTRQIYEAAKAAPASLAPSALLEALHEMPI